MDNLHSTADIRRLVVLKYMERRLMRAAQHKITYHKLVHDAAGSVRETTRSHLTPIHYPAKARAEQGLLVCKCGRVREVNSGMYILTRHCPDCHGDTPNTTHWIPLTPAWVEDTAELIAIVLDSGNRRYIQWVQEILPI